MRFSLNKWFIFVFNDLFLNLDNIFIFSNTSRQDEPEQYKVLTEQ